MSTISVNGESVETPHTNPTPPSIGNAPIISVAVQGPVGPQGPAGPEGPQGPEGPAGGAGFTFNQMSALAVWVITHNLGRFPPVTIVNEEGDEVYGDVNYTSDDVVTVTFSAAFSGIAYLG